MLVLSRRPGEQIVIGGDVVVTILSTARGRVRVGIEAPKCVDVRRSELDSARQVTRPPVDLDLVAQMAGIAH